MTPHNVELITEISGLIRETAEAQAGGPTIVCLDADTAISLLMLAHDAAAEREDSEKEACLAFAEAILQCTRHSSYPGPALSALVQALTWAETQPTYLCAKCGSTDVHHALWVHLETGDVREPFGTWCAGDNSFCANCQEHCRLEKK